MKNIYIYVCVLLNCFNKNLEIRWTESNKKLIRLWFNTIQFNYCTIILILQKMSLLRFEGYQVQIKTKLFWLTWPLILSDNFRSRYSLYLFESQFSVSLNYFWITAPIIIKFNLFNFKFCIIRKFICDINVTTDFKRRILPDVLLVLPQLPISFLYIF